MVKKNAHITENTTQDLYPYKDIKKITISAFKTWKKHTCWQIGSSLEDAVITGSLTEHFSQYSLFSCITSIHPPYTCFRMLPLIRLKRKSHACYQITQLNQRLISNTAQFPNSSSAVHDLCPMLHYCWLGHGTLEFTSCHDPAVNGYYNHNLSLTVGVL